MIEKAADGEGARGDGKTAEEVEEDGEDGLDKDHILKNIQWRREEKRQKRFDYEL